MKGWRNILKCGVSTACLYPDYLEDCFLQLAENGIKNTEIFVNSDCEMYNPYLSEMLAVKKEYDIDVVSVHPFTCGLETMMFFTDYDRRVNDMLEYYKRFFDYMNKFEAKFFILHGNKKENPFPEQKYFERFAYIQETAKAFGVSVLHENVSRCTAGNLGFLENMAEYLGEKAQFVLDTKQAHRAGFDPAQFVKKLGSHIKHIHFSDFGVQGDCLKFGFGEYDNFSFFSELKKNNYNGAVLLELYRRNFTDINDLSENCKVLQNFIDNNGF